MKRSGTRALAVLLVFAFFLSFLPTPDASAKKSKKASIKSVTITNAKKIKGKTLVSGKSFTLKVKVKTSGKGKISKKVTYKSSNKKVATVSSKGVIKAKTVTTTSAVTVTVTSKADKKKTAKVKFYVDPKPAPTVNPDELTDDDITEDVNPIDTISFVSSSLTYAVDEDDINDLSDPQIIYLGDDDSTDDNGSMYALSITTIDGSSFDKSKLSWGIADGNKNIIKLASNGTITFAGFGTVTVTAYYGSKSASLFLTIAKDTSSDEDDDDDDDYSDGSGDGSGGGDYEDGTEDDEEEDSDEEDEDEEEDEEGDDDD